MRGRVDQGQLFRLRINIDEHARRLIMKDQYGRQDGRRDVADGSFDGLDLQASTARGARQQSKAETVVFDRKTG